LAKLASDVEQLRLSREREAMKNTELESTVETLTRQRDAHHSAAAEAASQLGDDVNKLRVALEDSSRRERQVA